MKIEISSKVNLDLSRDVRQLADDLIIRSSEFAELYRKIYDYCSVLRLKTTSYPYVINSSTTGDEFVATKIVIETHSGSMIEDDRLLIDEFNILIEKLEREFKYIEWNLSVQ